MTVADISCLYEKCQQRITPILPYLDYAPSLFSKIAALERLSRQAMIKKENHKAEILTALKSDLEVLCTALEALLQEKSSSPNLTDDEVTWMVFYLSELVVNTSGEPDLHVNDYIALYGSLKTAKILSLDDEAIYLALLVRLFSKSTRFWRARPYVESLVAILTDSVIDTLAENAPEVLESISTFYFTVSDMKKAYRFAKEGAYLALAIGDPDTSKELMASALRARAVLPTELREEVDIEQIEKDFSASVLHYLDKPTMQHDPIEHTDAFLTAFDDVMEAVQDRIDCEGDLHIPEQRWIMMREEFSKRGIVWKDPSMMNRGFTFS